MWKSVTTFLREHERDVVLTLVLTVVCLLVGSGEYAAIILTVMILAYVAIARSDSLATKTVTRGTLLLVGIAIALVSGALGFMAYPRYYASNGDGETAPVAMTPYDLPWMREPPSIEACTSRVSAITVAQVLADGKGLSPYDRDQVRQKFIDQCVEWEATYEDFFKNGPSIILDLWAPPENANSEQIEILAHVGANPSADVRFAKIGDAMTVRGRIFSVANGVVQLARASITRQPVVADVDTCTKFSQLTPHQLADEGKELPAFSRQEILKAHVGECVRWTMALTNLSFRADRASLHMSCANPQCAIGVMTNNLSLSDSPDVRLAKIGDLLEIIGKVKDIESNWVTLSGARVRRSQQ